MGGGGDEIQETSAQKAVAEIASKEAADYYQRWVPVQKRFMSRVTDTKGRKDVALGRTSAEVAGRFSEAQQGLDATLANRGVGLGSGRQVLAAGNLGGAEAQSRGSGLAGTDQALDAEYLQGLAQIVGIGRGQKTAATQGLDAVSRISGMHAAADAEAAAARHAGIGQAIGTGVGMAGGLAMGGGKGLSTPGAPTSGLMEMPGNRLDGMGGFQVNM
jgi:hypothetical protein